MNAIKLLLVLVCATVCYCAYHEVDHFSGNTFFNGWSFFDGDDPTQGYVNYVNENQAKQDGLIKVDNGKVIISVDTRGPASGRGRNAVRIQTDKTYTDGLFVMDLDHMPEGCATWPAWWLCGANWPNNGEIDIIEGVNKATTDLSTLHTSNGCTQNNVNSNSFTGNMVSKNCYINAPNQYANQGCSIVSPNGMYGSALNAQGGGVYATLWDNSNIKFWFWNHNSVPADLRNGNPNPSTWDKPYALFDLGGDCPDWHFNAMQLVLNTCLCGSWAGSVFAQDCPGLGSCQGYVQNQPHAFNDAYWSINYIKVFQQ
eukprot:TRINITY_DN3896_c0_g1_i1.p1 TRINITY_DN3896_c0_g1~~TRINITY_DN3896_c0_g1_i1.p1  ORF type:complete len:313 (+),score=67.57 TRINITY_DN3896_c0_g1_i1:198-1136(+)